MGAIQHSLAPTHSITKAYTKPIQNKYVCKRYLGLLGKQNTPCLRTTDLDACLSHNHVQIVNHQHRAGELAQFHHKHENRNYDF